MSSGFKPIEEYPLTCKMDSDTKKQQEKDKMKIAEPQPIGKYRRSIFRVDKKERPIERPIVKKKELENDVETSKKKSPRK